MNILMLNDALDRGGIEILLTDIINSNEYISKKLNSNIKLLLSKRKGNMIESPCLPENIVVIEREKIIDLKYILKLRKYLKYNKFDVIHSHSPIMGMYIWIAKYGLNIPLYQTIHGFWDKKRNPIKRNSWGHLTITILLSWACKNNIYVSQYLEKAFREYPVKRKNSVIIYNGVNFSKFNVSNKPLPKKEYIFGMIGNFNNGRDHESLLLVFSELSKKYKTIKLLLAGIGEYYEKYQKLVKQLKLENKIVFLGNLPNVSDLLNSINCYVYCSNSDTFGLTIIEAGYFNIPIIVSDNGPFKELSEKLSLILYKAKNRQILYEKMEQAIVDRSDYVFNNNIVNDQFSINKHIDNLFNLYKSNNG